MTKSKGNGTAQGANIAEAADKAQGAQNVAENLAAENAAPVTPEVKARGRKAARFLTFPKFAAEIRKGGIPDGVEYVPPQMEGNKVMAWGYFRATNPVMGLDENQNLTLTELYTEGRSNKPNSKVIATIPAEEVLALLNSRKK